MAKDALGARARDEFGIQEHMVANPVRAALTSAATFAVGASLPILALLISPKEITNWSVSAASLLVLAALVQLAQRPVAQALSSRPFASPSGVHLRWR